MVSCGRTYRPAAPASIYFTDFSAGGPRLGRQDGGEPTVERGERLLALQAVALFLVTDTAARAFVERWQQVEGDVGGLEMFRRGMRDVVEQRTNGGLARR